ncbi:serine/threonine protein kinase [bacterium]|nr:serine/threonine protein kinase [bacterium]
MTGLLGEGGFGRVYRGFDPVLTREVAIKVPLRAGLSPDVRERFLREARAAATIHHPNVCPIHDVGTDGDLPFIVMHFVAGGTLAGLLARRKSLLPLPHAAAIVRKLALGVAAAHQVGVVHRDLKPQNVLWDDARRQVLITDFGLARVTGDAAFTPERQVFGTLAYMSPEQAAGRNDEVGPRSDVYTRGVILYEMLTGGPPFRGTVYELLWKVAQELPPSALALRPDLDPWLDAICAKAMAKAATARYASARALADDLAAYLSSRPGDGEVVVGEVVVGEPVEAVAAAGDELAGEVERQPEEDESREPEPVTAPTEKEVLACPACGVRMGVSYGRTKPVGCPVCRHRFDPEAGRDAVTRETLATVAATRTSRFDPTPDRRGESQPPRYRTARRVGWSVAIVGVVLSGVGMFVAAVCGCLALAVANAPGAGESGGTGWTRVALVSGLAVCGVGRWVVGRLPRGVGGAIAARLGAAGPLAAGFLGAHLLTATPTPTFHVTPSPENARLLALLTGAVVLAVLGEIVFTLYFAALGRELGPGYPRRHARAARNRLCYLLCSVALGGTALVLLAEAGRTHRAATALTATVVIAGVVSAYFLIVALYHNLAAHFGAATEMWRDAYGDPGE